eukprot:14976967-Alexandrium_andersonii.AAC.1
MTSRRRSRQMRAGGVGKSDVSVPAHHFECGLLRSSITITTHIVGSLEGRASHAPRITAPKITS